MEYRMRSPQQDSLMDCTHLDLKLEIDLNKETLRFINKSGHIINLEEYEDLHYLEQSKYHIKDIQEYVANNIDSLFLKCFIFKELTRGKK